MFTRGLSPDLVTALQSATVHNIF